MTADTVWILCSAAQAFLLCFLFDFSPEAEPYSPRGPGEALPSDAPKSNIVPLQLVGPASIAFWSEGTWARFLSSVDGANSDDRRNESATNRAFDAAA